MMRKALFLILALTALVLLVAGCGSEAEIVTNPTDDYAHGTLHPVADGFMATIGDNSSTMYYVYTPAGYDANGSYPVLYLLNGYSKDENYFVGVFDARDALDQLIAEGEIDPMILVMPSGHNSFGGGFYVNSAHPAVGQSEQHILDIITEVESNYAVDVTRRGIAGHSMGGYGAMSIALDNPAMFKTVASMSGPITFWGTKTSPPHTDTLYTGIETLIPALLAETGYDTSADSSSRAQYVRKIYPDATRRVTSMMFAMAAAFSPTLDPAHPGPTTIPDVWVDLPVDTLGNLDMPTWSRWLANDILARLSGMAQASVDLSSMKLYLDCGSQDDLGLYGATQVVAGALTNGPMSALGIQLTFDPTMNGTSLYGPMDDILGTIPAGHTQQIYERVKLLLKWEGDNL